MHIDGFNHAIHKHSSRSQHNYILTNIYLYFEKFAPLNLYFFKTKLGIHRRLFEGRHLVLFVIMQYVEHKSELIYPGI